LLIVPLNEFNGPEIGLHAKCVCEKKDKNRPHS